MFEWNGDLMDENRELPLSEVENELCTLAGQIAAASCRFLELVGQFDRREGWAGEGIKSCAHWLSWRCGIDLRTAREHVRVARSLAELPLLRETFAAGRLSYSKVRAIARVATAVSEEDLVNAGLNAPAAQLERLTRGLRTAARNIKKDAGEGVHSRGVAPDGSVAGVSSEPAKPEGSRPYLQWRWDDDGRLVVWGRLNAVDGAALLAAAARHAQADAADRAGAEPGSPVPSPLPPADLVAVLSAMSQRVLCSDDLSNDMPRFAPAAEVTVLVGLDELQQALAESDPDADGRLVTGAPARLQDGPALDRAALRRLVDDGNLRTAVLAGDGRTLDLGRRSRRLTRRQSATLWRRDGGCRTPGCGRSRFLHAHHVRFWSRGGASSLDNLLLLCGEHHRQLHEGKFRIAALGEQRFAFRHPDGTPWSAAPAVAGQRDDLQAAHADVTAAASTPNWDGRRLDLGLAVATYLDSWAVGKQGAAAS